MLRKILFLVAFALVSAANAQISLYVDSSVSASGNGASWTAAYKTLGQALNVVNADSYTANYTIHIARGTYYPAGTAASTDDDSAFVISRRGVALLGGYPAGGGTRNPALNPTSLNGTTGAGGAAFHILLFVNSDLSHASDSVTLDGLDITSGGRQSYASGSRTYYGTQVYRGAGTIVAYRFAGKIVFNGCRIHDNLRNGITADQVSISMSGCSMTRNAGQYGGAVEAFSCSLGLRGCTLSGNVAKDGNGGAIDLSDGTLAIDSCTFSRDTAYGAGGAINASRDDMKITNSTFDGNAAQDMMYRSPEGGAIYLNGGTDSIRNCRITNNTAYYDGGGIYILGAACYIGGCTISGNVSVSSIYGGGGIAGDNINFGRQPFTLENSVLSFNTAGQYGGGLQLFGDDRPTNTISHCTIQGNTAYGGGGGISVTMNGSIDHCLFSGNRAAFGGGAIIGSGSTTNPVNQTDLSNNVFSGNKATATTGGGLYIGSCGPTTVGSCTFGGNAARSGGRDIVTVGYFSSCTVSPSITNCILWDGDSSLLGGQYSMPNVTSSIVEDAAGNYTGTPLTAAPLFVSPHPNTFAPDTGGDYRITACSPAIDEGNTGIYPGATDAAGNPRVYGFAVDIGAYEYQGSRVVAPSIGGNNVVCRDGVLQLSTATGGGVWSSSARATVSTAGLVTPLAAGADTVYYTVSGTGCARSSEKVITIFPAASVGPITGPARLCPNAAVVLTASPGNGTWSSAAPGIATVSSTGTVTGVASGTDTIRYVFTDQNGCTADTFAVITVDAPPVVAAVTGNATLCPGASTALSCSTPGGTWSSDNTSVATVGGTGMVSGIAPGSATLSYTVTGSNGCTGASTRLVTVNAGPAVAGISGPGTVCAGGTAQLSDATGGGVWTSGNPGVASVSAGGLVTFVSPGTATIRYTVTGGNGCATTVSAALTAAPTYNNAVRDTTCAGTPYPFGGRQLTTAGTYAHVFQAASGCDSTVRLTLAVTTLNPVISQTGTTLLASPSGARYQWIDCATNTAIAGAAAQRFTPSANGSYAVIVTKNGCAQKSACRNVTGVGIAGAQSPDDGIRVFPNPVSGTLYVTTGRRAASAIVLRDVTGRALQVLHPSGSAVQLDLGAYASGLYLLEVHDAAGMRFANYVEVTH